MRLTVKPHQAFFISSSAARPSPAAGLLATLLPRPAALCPGLLSPTRGAPRRSAVAQAILVGGVRLGPGARPERPSIRVGPATAPSTLYRVRVERPARLKE